MSFLGVMDERAYGTLLASLLPRVIHSEEENERCIATLETLHDRGNLSPEEDRLAELLTLLIEDFESKHYQMTPASPVEVIQELMSAHSLKQSDMVAVFGNKEIAGKVLAGEMDLSRSQIEELSHRFHVSPEVFFAAKGS